MTMDMSKYKELFLSESQEHIQNINQLLISLENDPSNQDTVNNLFREAHSLKGMAASMQYDEIADLSHLLEDALSKVRDGKIKGNIKELIELIFEGIDILQKQIEDISTTSNSDIDTTSYSKKIGEYLSRYTVAPPPLSNNHEIEKNEVSLPQKKISDSQNTQIVLFSFKVSPTSSLPNARAFIAIKRIEEIGEIIEISPPIEDIKKGKLNEGVQLKFKSNCTLNQIKEFIKNLPEIETKDLSFPRVTPTASTKVTKKTTRVDLSLLDSLLDQVGELIINKSRLKELTQDSVQDEFSKCISSLSLLIENMHKQVMRIRLLPFEYISCTYPRFIRDIAKKKEKNISFEIIGKDIEIDRSILEEVSDPLLHILRNSIDHGIETPEERKSKGKNLEGKISIMISREKEHVNITISDDGKGIDPKEIRAKAIEKGLLDVSQANKLSDKESLMLITLPGLSTAEKITDISGRGVGMDVVKTKIFSIGGNFEIDSEVGRGTSLYLQLPLTIIIISALIVRIANHLFALPMTLITRTFSIKDTDIKKVQQQDTFEVDNELIPLINLKKLLKLDTTPNTTNPINFSSDQLTNKSTTQPSLSDGTCTPTSLLILNNEPGTTNQEQISSDEYKVIKIEVKGKKVGLLIDDIIKHQEIVVKRLGRPLENFKGYSGATILGDGKVILLLDIMNLL
ncbi:MAG: chemotaxis protein CheA [bacterium]